MKLFLLTLAVACAAHGQFGDARSLQRLPIKPGLTCANTQVITWVAANNEFECAASGAGGIVVTGTPSVGWEIVATSASTATWQAVQAANGHCTMSATTSCMITGLTGVVNKAVVSCWDNSGTLVEIIPNDFAGSTADTLVINFSAAQTGYCNASTGVGATGPASAPGAPSHTLQANDGAGGFAGSGLTYDFSIVPASPVFASPSPTDLNDCTGSGTYTDTANPGGWFFVSNITPGTPDTFQWAKCLADGSCGANSGDIALTGAAQLFSDGVSMTCTATTGHNASSQWSFQTGRLLISSFFQIANAGLFSLSTGSGSLPTNIWGSDGNGNFASMPTGTGALTNDGSGNLSWQTGLTQTIVVKGSAGSNCNLVLVKGRITSTTCP